MYMHVQKLHPATLLTSSLVSEVAYAEQKSLNTAGLQGWLDARSTALSLGSLTQARAAKMSVQMPACAQDGASCCAWSGLAG